MDDSQRRFCSNVVASLIARANTSVLNSSYSHEFGIFSAKCLKATEAEYHCIDMEEQAGYILGFIEAIDADDHVKALELYREMNRPMEYLAL